MAHGTRLQSLDRRTSRPGAGPPPTRLGLQSEPISTGWKEAERSLATLRRRALTLRRPNFAAEANYWFDQHLKPDGRGVMLTALRQEKAKERQADTVRTIRVPCATLESSQTLPRSSRFHS